MMLASVPAQIIHLIATYGAGALFALLMVGVFGLPVPDETLLTFAGVLVRQGHLLFATTWVAAALGSMCGISLSYTLGRTAGITIVMRYGRWLHITPEHLRRVEQWMERGGKFTLTFGYFIPGVRHLTAIVAGSTALPPRIFMGYAYTGAAIWSLTFITLGWYVGDEWQAVLAVIDRHILLISIVAGVAVIGYALVHRWRSRR